MCWKFAILNTFLSLSISASGDSILIAGVDGAKLGEKALPVHQAALALTKDSDNKVKQLAYLEAFPKEFSVFLEIFHARDFGQLYDGFSYIELFNQTASKHPDIAAQKYMALASGACFDADAPNYFREGLRNFEKTHNTLYTQQYELLTLGQQKNVKLFLSASFHPHDNTAGFCNF